MPANNTKWYVHFRNNAGHTSTFWVEHSLAQGAMNKATDEYRELNRCTHREAQEALIELGPKDG